ncbi:MAG: hemerythrin domain-containing protein [Actinocrinis sp.]
MCEYCGCQSVTSIGELTLEHDLVVDLIGEARAAHRAGDVPAMAHSARRIARILGPHTVVEESGLFPALAGDFPEQIAALEAEHRLIEAVLAQAGPGVPSDPGWPDALLDVLGVLRRHILKEQDGVFPAALASLTTAQWEVVDATRAEAGGITQPARGRAG